MAGHKYALSLLIRRTHWEVPIIMMAKTDIIEQTQKDEDEQQLVYELIQHVTGFKCNACGEEHDIALVEYPGKQRWQTRQGLLCLKCNGQGVTRICDDPECKSDQIFFDDHHCELYCRKCGLVLGQAPPMYCGGNTIDPVWFVLIKRLNFINL